MPRTSENKKTFNFYFDWLIDSNKIVFSEDYQYIIVYHLNYAINDLIIIKNSIRFLNYYKVQSSSSIV